MKKTNLLLASLFITALSFTSCDKEEILAQVQSDTTAIGASASIEAANALDIQTGIELNSSKNIVTRMAAPAPACYTITAVQTTYPKIFTIDYGTGCTINQVTRKGILKVTFTAPILEKDSKMTIERMDYYINGNKVEGTIEYVNKTTDASVPEWTRTVTNGKVTINGKVFTNSGSYTMKQTAGVSTISLSDNTYEMTAGSHTITNETGNSLTLTVQETLVKQNDCDYISKGKVKVNGGLLNGVIDYGNGDCDNKFTYTQEKGLSYELKM